uniref:Indole-3-acetate O-methyltransferase 1 n=1 Tax=Musa acuminata subsp. malaccensis TaxID=214687 RepID=A0A804HTE1_MUSAM
MAMAVKGENLVVTKLKLERMLSMKGGKGETSYLKNSQAQARHARAMLHFLEATLSAMKLPLLEDGGTFAVADLGCSCGTNTLFLMGIIVEHVPERVTDKRSPAYNGGRVFVHGASADTAAAYKQQFQADLASFLRARAVEMKVGGVMFLVCLGRTSIDPADQGGAGFLFGAHFQDAWNDLVEEGLLESEKRDSFNIPVYAACLREFKEVVEAEGSFSINKLQVVKGGSPLVVNHPEDASEVGRALANSCRSVAGVLVEAHIGERLSEELFGRLELRAARHARELMEQMQFFHIVASLSPSLPSHPAS